MESNCEKKRGAQSKKDEEEHTDYEHDGFRDGKKNTVPSWLRQYITFIWGEEAFVSPKGPKQAQVSGRERMEEKEGGRGRVKEIRYRDREEEDKDDSWLGTSCIWQG